MDDIKGKSVHLNYELDEVGQASHKFRTTALMELIEKAFAGRDPGNIKILDMACGRGEMMALCLNKGFQVQGMDVDPNCVNIASKYGLVSIGNYSKMAEIFETDFFDMTISSHSLEHLQDPKKDALNLVRISKEFVLIALPNPMEILNVINVGIFRRIQDVNKGHIYVWDHRHLRNFITSHLNLHVVAWHADYVRIFPKRFGIRKLMWKLNLLGFIEQGLARLFPYFANSIIVLTHKSK